MRQAGRVPTVRAPPLLEISMRRLALFALLAPLACSRPGVDVDLEMYPTTEGLAPQPRSLPIWGGTLITSRDGIRAFAADPEWDRFYAVDLKGPVVLFRVSFESGAAPWRL